MHIELIYQRWLEFDLPPELAAEKVPMWTWPVALSDGRAILTLLYRPLPKHAATACSGPRTLILELSREGEASAWKPGMGYPAPVIFYANDTDDLVGMDLVKTGKIYACRVDGTHLWTLEMRLKMENLIAPRRFVQRGKELFWERDDGVVMQATLAGNSVQNARSANLENTEITQEVHFPHNHITRDGTLWVFDFDPMPRVSRYQLHRPAG